MSCAVRRVAVPGVVVPGGVLELDVHPGFPDAGSARAWAEGVELEPGLFALVRFLGGWYVVVYDTLAREVVAGSEVVWYSLDFLWECVPVASFRLPYRVRSLGRAYGWREGVWQDLLAVDFGLGVYLVRHPRLSPGVVEVTRYGYARAYAILVGVTFYARWWSPEDCCGVLGRYFAHAWSWPERFRACPGVVGINPFRGLVLLRDGSVRRWRFWVPDGLYWARRCEEGVYPLLLGEGVPAPSRGPGSGGGVEVAESPVASDIDAEGGAGEVSVAAPVAERRYRWPFPLAEGFRPRPLPCNRDFLWEAKRFRYVLQAPAVACTDGALELDLGAVRGRVALEESGCRDAGEMARLVGRHVVCVLLRIDGEVAECSRRRALEVMARRSWEKVLKPGRDVWAVVRGYCRGGVEVDAGGVAAEVPFRELSPGWVFDAREEFPVGRELKLRVVEADAESGRLVLSGRPHFRDPWRGVEVRYREGGVYAGVVVNEHRGLLFVQLEPGLDACCPRPAFQDVGRGVRVVVQLDSVDGEKKRLRGHVLQVLVPPGKLPY